MKTNFAPGDVKLMGGACDEAWKVLRTALVGLSEEYEEGIRSGMAGRVMAAVEDGERDPNQLKSIALG